MIEVKELEWSELKSYDFLQGQSAESPFGQYSVTIVPGGRAAYHTPGEGIKEAKSADVARAACQADFSRRVLACVTVSEAQHKALVVQALTTWELKSHD